MAKNYMIGNWKMNQTLSEIETFFANLNLSNNQNNFWIAPQILHLGYAKNLAEKAGVLIGSQNCSENSYGAYTGETSPDSLMEMGVHFTLLGHSERRSYYGETDKLINSKTKTAIEKGLVPVVCVGETLEEREAEKTMEVVLHQVKEAMSDVELNNESELIIAYEPVWAIGTGKTATPDQAEAVHTEIRKLLIELYGDLGQDISILYGGSVKPENVQELLSKPNINGGLVGGASLKAESFSQLCDAC